MTSQEAKTIYTHYLTVGQLRDKLDKYPDDALVVAQRVEDIYYETRNWKTIDKPDLIYPDYTQQYSPVWSTCDYNDDNCLFLDLHY
jgi:hypothetical protein